jgi:hypothetical protein
MIIGYKRVTIDDANWFATAGTIATDIALSDGKPATRTRVTNASLLLGLSANFDETSQVRMIAILGITASVNGGAASSTFPGTSEIEVTCGAYNVTMDPNDHIGPDGRCNVYLVLPAAISASDIAVGVVIDQSGVTASYLDVGEIAVFDGVEVCARPGASWTLIDPTEVARTIGQQMHAAARRPYRRLNAEIRPTSETATVGTVGSDIESMRYALSRDKLGLVCLDDSSQATVTRSTVFGRVTIGDLQHVAQSKASNRLYTATVTAEEIPAGDAAS